MFSLLFGTGQPSQETSSSFADQEEEEEEQLQQQEEEEEEVEKALFPQPRQEEAATLSSLLVRALPQAAIRSPRLVLLGAQSSGKTRQALGLALHYLLATPGFSDAMGEVLLQIFRTGNQTVTYRPIEINLLNTSSSYYSSSPGKDREEEGGAGGGGGCSLKMSLDEVEAVFPSPRFDQLLALFLHSVGHHVSPLRLFLSSPHLPNISFTDLPGLTTTDRPFLDQPRYTVKSLVEEVARDDQNVLVLLETAQNVLDLDTSHIAPMIKRLAQEGQDQQHFRGGGGGAGGGGGRGRADIFHHSILVISKCDALSEDYYDVLVDEVLQRSRQMREDYPFEHVVAVINKFYRDPEPHAVPSFRDFKDLMAQTQEKERRRFEEIFSKVVAGGAGGGGGGVAADYSGTAQVFHAMDLILVQWLMGRFQKASLGIEKELRSATRRLYTTTSPPPRYYVVPSQASDYPAISLEAMVNEFATHAESVCVGQLEEVFEEVAGSLRASVATLAWPCTRYGDLAIARKQRETLEGVRHLLYGFVDALELPRRIRRLGAVAAVGGAGAGGGGVVNGYDMSDFSFSQKQQQQGREQEEEEEVLEALFRYPSLHAIERFPRLCAHLQHLLLHDYLAVLDQVKAQVVDRGLDRLYRDAVPQPRFDGDHLVEAVLAMAHCAARAVADHMAARLASDMVYEVREASQAQREAWLQEEEEGPAARRRRCYRSLWKLSIQRDTLASCCSCYSHTLDLQTIRAILQEGAERLARGELEEIDKLVAAGGGGGEVGGGGGGGEVSWEDRLWGRRFSLSLEEAVLPETSASHPLPAAEDDSQTPVVAGGGGGGGGEMEVVTQELSLLAEEKGQAEGEVELSEEEVEVAAGGGWKVLPDEDDPQEEEEQQEEGEQQEEEEEELPFATCPEPPLPAQLRKAATTATTATTDSAAVKRRRISEEALAGGGGGGEEEQEEQEDSMGWSQNKSLQRANRLLTSSKALFNDSSSEEEEEGQGSRRKRAKVLGGALYSQTLSKVKFETTSPDPATSPNTTSNTTSNLVHTPPPATTTATTNNSAATITTNTNRGSGRGSGSAVKGEDSEVAAMPKTIFSSFFSSLLNTTSTSNTTSNTTSNATTTPTTSSSSSRPGPFPTRQHPPPPPPPHSGSRGSGSRGSGGSGRRTTSFLSQEVLDLTQE